jgi:hypothetical protein
MSFADDLTRIANSVVARNNLIVSKIITDVATELVEKSPVGDADYWIMKPPPGYVGGRFRANWQFGIGAANTETTEKTDPSGSATISDIVGKLPSNSAGNIYYITNSLPYAQRLEEGYSKRQAPRGMVTITVLEFEPIVAAAARAMNQ